MEPEGSLPHSQVPTTCPCPKPDQCSRWPHIPPSNLALINISNSGICYCTQHLSERIGEEAELREQLAVMYGIESAVEMCYKRHGHAMQVEHHVDSNDSDAH